MLDAVTAYMNVLANQSLVDAQRINVTFLRETLTTTRKRLDAGDVTPTDVAQAEARQSRGLADLNAAEVALAVSRALYTQVIGSPPGRLIHPASIDRLLPRTRDDAIATARKEHPAIRAAMYDTDVAVFGTKIAESSLWPATLRAGRRFAQPQRRHSRSVRTASTTRRSSRRRMSRSMTADLPPRRSGNRRNWSR